MRNAAVLLALVLAVVAASKTAAQDAASEATRAILAGSAVQFDLADQGDFDAALRGRIARYPRSDIRTEEGRLVWRFVDEDVMRAAAAPPTVHPLLWRQQQLNAISGLFEIVPGVYQLRGFDLGNMTIIEGERGVIVVDPLTTVEVAHAALEFYFTHRPRRPVTAVIYTHSHVDHFGGVRGVVSADQVANGEVSIIAPGGFLREAISENLSAGNAMLRRTIYFSGLMLEPGPLGSMGAGLGPGVSNGTQSFIAPTEEIGEAYAERVVDGVRIQFLAAHGTEAPSESVFFLPEKGVLNVAEVAVRTMHNVLTPRGAKVRDAAAWWQAIDAMLTRFGGETQVLIGQHHWPSWGNAAAIDHLVSQRDLYKAAHDRALHLANQGVTLDEIGDAMVRPANLAATFSAQDHYGTFAAAGKATYQYYLGWYDGNPAHLDQLPPAQGAVQYVAYMGGAAAVLERARADFAAGNYRWVAQVLDHVIFADPGNMQARELQAATLTQLGYQQSSATWRNIYLTAARELRSGVVPIPPGARSADYLANMNGPMMLDFAGIALSPQRAAQAGDMALDIAFTDLGTAFRVTIRDGLLTYRPTAADSHATSIQLDRTAFDALLSQRARLTDGAMADRVVVEGDRSAAERFFTLFDRFAPDFNIVTP